MDYFLAIVGITVSAGSLVQVFAEKDPKLKAVAVIISITLIGLTIGFLYWWADEAWRFNEAENQIGAMFVTDNPMSLDQIFKRADRLSYDTVSAAVEDMKAKGSLQSDLVPAKDTRGHEYTVRVYNSINFPIPR